MGIFSDYLANTKSIDVSYPREAIDRRVYLELEAFADFGDPTLGGSYAASDSVQVIAEYTTDPTSGTFALVFTLPTGQVITTAGIAYDANAATIEGAIDTAFAGVTGFTAGDIAVTAESTNLPGGDITLTFDGAAVDDMAWPLVKVNKGSLVRTFLNVTPQSTSVAGVNGMTDEVQRIARYAANPSGGTFTLTFNITGQPAVTTAPIAYNAGAATVEAAIDAAFTAATDVATAISWTNSDISVTAESTNLLGGYLQLTYDGNSVDETNQGQAIIDGSGLTHAGFGAAVTKTANGSATREALNILFHLGVVTGSVNAAGAAAEFTLGPARTYGRMPSDDLIRALARDAAIAEASDLVYNQIRLVTGA